MTEQHPLTDEMLDSIAPWPINRLPGEYVSMRSVADWQLEQVIKWLKFDYLVDPSLSLEVKHRSDWWKIADALEKAMRPQEDKQP